MPRVRAHPRGCAVSALLEGHAAVNLLREAMTVIGALPLSACNDERGVA